MSTGQGTPADPAPRIAYEIGAAAAADDAAEVFRLWAPLDGPGRVRVLAALGAQARNAAHAAGHDPGTIREFLRLQARYLAAGLTSCPLQAAALSALSGAPLGPLPDGGECPAAAVALAQARLLILQRIGFRPQDVAELSRRAARR